jgi:hypothetical protein
MSKVVMDDINNSFLGRRIEVFRRLPCWAELLLVFGLSLGFFAYFQFQSAYLPGTDAYYHIKIAYVIRTQGFLANFKWASLSMWVQNFSDKEFLYHLWLLPFTLFSNLAFGAKLATVFLASLAVTSFFAILRLNRFAAAWFWFALLLVSGGYFLYRINVPRPQVLSVLLALWSVHFILNHQHKRLAVLCFFYAWSYTAFHLPLIFSLIVSGSVLLFERKVEWKTPLLVLLSTLAGMCIHPYFPDNFRLFYYQNFYILWMSKFAPVDLHMGNEFARAPWLSLLSVSASVTIPYLAFLVTQAITRQKIEAKTRHLFFISLSLIFLTLLVKRFAEYSVPFTLIFCAAYFTAYWDRIVGLWSLVFRRHCLQESVLMLLVFGYGVLAMRSHNDVRPQFLNSAAGFADAAHFMAEKTEPDEVVFTCDWDDAPPLFFHNHRNRYLVFLDPNFMYIWDPEIWRRWDKVAHGNFGQATYDVLKNDFGVRFGVCTQDFSKLKKRIQLDSRLRIVRDDPKVYVFEVGERPFAEKEVVPPKILSPGQNR